MYCPKCGADTGEDALFCRQCGAALQQGKEEKRGKGKGLNKKILYGGIAAFVVVAAVAAGIVLTVGKGDISDGNDDGEEEIVHNTDQTEIPEEETAAERDPLFAQLVSYESAQYNYSGLSYLDLSVRNYAPNPKQEGMDWDSALFYSLEDVSADSAEDNKIAGYRVSNYEFINAQTNNLIRCIVYTNPENAAIHKIVTVEQQDGGYLISDYYYDNAKPNFVFTRTVDVYTPTYATIDKIGTRCYFHDDVMVRYRTIRMPREIVQQTLKPTVTWYHNVSYFELSSEERAEYDAVEYQVLNEAYNVYNAVAGQANIIDLAGQVYSADGMPLENVSVAVIASSDSSVLYSGKTDKEGFYHIYIPLDSTDCYIQIYLEGYLPVYIYNVKLDQGLLNNYASYILLSPENAGAADAKLYLYDSLELTMDENAAAISGAQVTVRRGLQATEGEEFAKGITNEEGFCELSLPQGAYTAEFSSDGYSVTYESFFVISDASVVRAYTVPAITDRTEKIVLVWDSELDLDLVLFTPEKSAYGNMNYVSMAQPVDNYHNFLVADAVNSRCEVLSLSNELAGVYKVFVNDYTSYQNGEYSSNALALSGAKVYVFSAEGLVTVYYIDRNQPGIVWNVCDRGEQYSVNSIVSATIDAYTVIDKTRITKSAALDAYRQFMLGNLQGNYNGEMVNCNDLFEKYCDEASYDAEEYGVQDAVKSFALTDYNSDNLPELQIYLNAGMWEWYLYTIEFKKEGLTISRGIGGGYMDVLTLYENGCASLYHGLSAASQCNWILDINGDPLAWIEYGYDSWLGDLDSINSWMEEEYDRARGEGYKYIYITHGSDFDSDALASFEKYLSDFATEYCGGEIIFYNMDESSIQENLRWD